jgi:hypothetical protein
MAFGRLSWRRAFALSAAKAQLVAAHPPLTRRGRQRKLAALPRSAVVAARWSVVDARCGVERVQTPSYGQQRDEQYRSDDFIGDPYVPSVAFMR